MRYSFVVFPFGICSVQIVHFAIAYLCLLDFCMVVLFFFFFPPISPKRRCCVRCVVYNAIIYVSHRRTKSQYCYVHLRSGDIRWEYPSDEICDTAARNADTTKQKHSAEVAASKTAPSSPTPVAGNDAGLTPAGSRRGDDEMDICTTPPPNGECIFCIQKQRRTR